MMQGYINELICPHQYVFLFDTIVCVTKYCAIRIFAPRVFCYDDRSLCVARVCCRRQIFCALHLLQTTDFIARPRRLLPDDKDLCCVICCRR
jgi:hypothetical protein